MPWHIRPAMGSRILQEQGFSSFETLREYDVRATLWLSRVGDLLTRA